MRFSILLVRKTYQYRVHNRAASDVFRRNYAVHEPHPLNVKEMRRAAAHLIGEHDFTSFCASKTDVKNKVRTIYRIEIERIQDELVFTFEGSGFLYNMVRILMGTFLEIGRGRRSANEMVSILEAKDRNTAGKTAPPHGLYLLDGNFIFVMFVMLM